MIYLYGLIDAAPADVLARVDGMMGLQSLVEVSPIGDWTLLHSEHDAEPILPRRRLMLAHTRVLERVLTLPAVLPARFGLVAEDLDTARRLILPREGPLTAAFDHVRDAAEFGVRVRFDRDRALAATLAAFPALQRERDTLLSRGRQAYYDAMAFGERLGKALDQRRADAQKAILSALRPAVRDHVLRAPAADNEVLRVEFLISRAHQDNFPDILRHATEMLTFAPEVEAEIQIIGPAPAYHFVHLNLSPSQAEKVA